MLNDPVHPAELIAHVAKRVSRHKQIRRLEIVREIPKSPSGKILRRMLVISERAAAADALAERRG